MLVTTTYGTALIAALLKSVNTAKVALGLFCFQLGSSIVGVLFLVIIIFSMDKKPQPDAAIVVVAFMILAALLVQSLYGWLLLVMLRDLRGQPRDSLGRLVLGGIRIF